MGAAKHKVTKRGHKEIDSTAELGIVKTGALKKGPKVKCNTHYVGIVDRGKGHIVPQTVVIPYKGGHVIELPLIPKHMRGKGFKGIYHMGTLFRVFKITPEKKKMPHITKRETGKTPYVVKLPWIQHRGYDFEERLIHDKKLWRKLSKIMPISKYIGTEWMEHIKWAGHHPESRGIRVDMFTYEGADLFHHTFKGMRDLGEAFDKVSIDTLRALENDFLLDTKWSNWSVGFGDNEGLFPLIDLDTLALRRRSIDWEERRKEPEGVGVSLAKMIGDANFLYGDHFRNVIPELRSIAIRNINNEIKNAAERELMLKRLLEKLEEIERSK
jgi:hypothetical protein